VAIDERRRAAAAASSRPSPAFTGRDDTLATTEAAFKGDEGRIAITALHGLRGDGKSTLAAAYAERHHSRICTGAATPRQVAGLVPATCPAGRT
jgi:hypothetical protein